VNQPRGLTAADDLLTCVCVCFLEHIPEIPEAWAEIGRWLTPQELANYSACFGNDITQ
jgi:hypothetical protein